MKKFWKYALILVGATAILSACGGSEESLTLDHVKNAYEEIRSSVKIEQTIEIKSGMLVQYSSRRDYVLSGEEYLVHEETTRLNPHTEEDAVTHETKDYSRTKAETFSSTLNISDTCLQEISVADGTLTATVKEGAEEEFLSVESFSAPVENMKVSFTLKDGRMAEIEISYRSGASDVGIVLQYLYSEAV